MDDLVERLFDCGSNAEGAEKLCVEAAEEITRLRAALADAQAVGFAAGVEAAAKVASGRWAHWMETADRLYEMDDREARQDSDRATCRATEATAIATAIRAIAGDAMTEYSDEAVAAMREALKRTTALVTAKQLCRHCGGRMLPGISTDQTYVGGTPDFPGDAHASTFSAGGPGKVIECRKCENCGWSVT